MLGYDSSDILHTDLVEIALRRAAALREPATGATAGVIFHADRGCQYASAPDQPPLGHRPGHRRTAALRRAPRPGSQIYVDVTKFGNIPHGGGHRFTGRAPSAIGGKPPIARLSNLPGHHI